MWNISWIKTTINAFSCRSITFNNIIYFRGWNQNRTFAQFRHFSISTPLYLFRFAHFKGLFGSYVLFICLDKNHWKYSCGSPGAHTDFACNVISFATVHRCQNDGVRVQVYVPDTVKYENCWLTFRTGKWSVNLPSSIWAPLPITISTYLRPCHVHDKPFHFKLIWMTASTLNSHFPEKNEVTFA